MSSRWDPTLRLRPVLVVVAATMVFVGVVMAAIWWIYMASGPERPAAAVAADPPPAIDLGETRRAWEAPMRQRLASYGWVDREAGLVHVPVERAVELVLAEGLPTVDDIEGGSE